MCCEDSRSLFCLPSGVHDFPFFDVDFVPHQQKQSISEQCNLRSDGSSASAGVKHKQGQGGEPARDLDFFGGNVLLLVP